MKKMHSLCKVFFVLIYAKHACTIKYVPSNREIEALQNDKYTFGIDYDYTLKIKTCTVTGDTGIKYTFPVKVIYSEEHIQNDLNVNIASDLMEEENVITDLGSQTLCQVVVSNVQDTGPKLWNLVAKNQYDRLVADVNFTTNFIYHGSLPTNEIRIQESSSFLNYIIMPDDVSLDSCYVKINNTIKIDLDLHTPKTTILSSHTKNTNDLADRISSLGDGYCGLKFINSTRELDGIPWQLIAITDSAAYYRGSFITRIDIKNEETHLQTAVLLGEGFNIKCPNSVPNTFCSIYHPVGEIVEARKCEYEINSVTMKDIGLWKCQVHTSGDMKSTEHRIETTVKDERIVAWKNESDSYVNIGCTLTIARGISACRVVAPNNDVFNIEAGLATDRYLTIGTDFANSRCSLMIPKPLKEFEKGMWKCEMFAAYSWHSIIITIDDEKQIAYPRYLELIARTNKPLTISCDVPYSIDYCRIESPDGKTTYFPHDPQTLILGRCSHLVEKSSLNNSGNWTCHLARTTGVTDDKIVVNVAFADNLQSDRYVPIEAGGTAQLLCSARGAPLDYCRYVSPDGMSYHIRDKDISINRITYFGRGLNYGDCGISISNVTRDDYGRWRCVKQLLPDNRVESTSEVYLIVY